MPFITVLQNGLRIYRRYFYEFSAPNLNTKQYSDAFFLIPDSHYDEQLPLVDQLPDPSEVAGEYCFQVIYRSSAYIARRDSTRQDCLKNGYRVYLTKQDRSDDNRRPSG